MLTKDHDSIVSVPMYCKMSGISVNEVDYELLVIKLKPEYDNKKFLEKIYGDLNSMFHYFENVVPDEDQTYENKLKIENWKVNFENEFEKKASTLDGIFNVIVIISMALCFFSLSSSMSANIFDQSREISVMLSFGCTKNVLTRIFIYEALVLVIASSFGGFVIGIFIGNLITLQQAML
jgi:ABC-type lipoprotein release transport system permease subunit